jgi:coenzyme F420-reducing hydrogenase delta subunit
VNSYKPHIIVFRCNWCSNNGADLCGTSILQGAPHLRVIKTICSRREGGCILHNGSKAPARVA